MPPVDEGDGSVVGEDIVVDEEGVFEEVDLGDGEVLETRLARRRVVSR